MRYSLLVTAGPDSPAAASALQMAKTLLARDHSLYRIFFYRQGVHLASTDHRVSADIGTRWRSFLRGQDIEAVVCVGAAQRRGLDSAHLAAEFSLAGLGLWAEAVAVSDRVLSFGA